jgi:dipeptidase
MPLVKKGRLTGMDLLRLALERSADAAQALEVIVGLLADFGQGGICGYEDRRMAYHNSFIIADPQQGWVLETAGPMWAAVKIKESYSISNALSIGEQFDECHPKLIETARSKGWLKKGRTFHFARCYSDWFYTTFSAARRRQCRTFDLIGQKKGKLDAAAAVGILRDHGDDLYRPDSHFLGNRICAHAGNQLARNASQTVGSLVACLKPQRQTFFVTGTAAPCTAVFKPVWFGQNVLPELGPTPDGTYNPDALWWFHETLHRSVLVDFEKRLACFRQQRDELEKFLFERADGIAEHQRWELTCSAFQQAREKTAAWIEQVRSMPLNRDNKRIYRRYWEKQNRKAGITI